MDSITSVILRDDIIISSSKDRTIKIWKRKGPVWNKMARLQKTELFGHTKSVSCLFLENNTLISGGKDKTVRVWNLEAGPLSIIHTGITVYATQFCNNTVAVGGKDHRLKLYDLNTSKCTQILKGHKGWISCLQYQNSNQIITGGSDGKVFLWDTRAKKFAKTFKINSNMLSPGWITCLQADENKIVTGSADRAIKIVDIVTGKCVNTLKDHLDAVTCLQFDNEKIMSGSLDRSVKQWNFTNNVESNLIDRKASCVLS